VVEALLKHNADTEVVNSAGMTPLEVAQDPEIKKIIQEARIAQIKKRVSVIIESERAIVHIYIYV
jgi:hypothetical protein